MKRRFLRKGLADRARKSSRGSALVEFALVLPFLLLVMAGIITMGRWYLVKNRLVAMGQYGAWLKKAGCSSHDIQQRLSAEWSEALRSSFAVRVEGRPLATFFPSTSQYITSEMTIRPSWLLEGRITWKPLSDECVLTVDSWHYGIPKE